MSSSVQQQILDLDAVALTRVAQALYDPSLVSSPEAFESAPPSIPEVIAALAELVGEESAPALDEDDVKLARRALLIITESPEGEALVAPLLGRVREETMAPPIESVVLVAIILAALKDMILIEVDNQGAKGRWRFRFRLGGRPGEPSVLHAASKTALRLWLAKLKGALPPLLGSPGERAGDVLDNEDDE